MIYPSAGVNFLYTVTKVSRSKLYLSVVGIPLALLITSFKATEAGTRFEMIDCPEPEAIKCDLWARFDEYIARLHFHKRVEELEFS